MKNSILALLLIISFAFLTQAQDPKLEKVYSVVKVQYEPSWYIEQHELWKKELERKPKNADGWLSYYTTTRMVKVLAKDNTTREEWFEKMTAIVNEMKPHIKGTFEYHYIQGYHERDQTKGIEHIFKAYKLDPTRPEVYDDLVSYYEIKRDKEKLKEVCTNWKASGSISPTLLTWNYNMLMSTEKNAILITFGDNDTYPSWVLQNSANVRTDVTVINSSLILLEDYRNTLFKELNIPKIEGENLRGKTIVEHIIKHKGERPLYTAIVGNHAALGLGDNLFNVGLAMLYCEEEAHAVSYLVKNFENHILLDHLTYAVYTEAFPSAVDRYNLLYVPGMMTLYKHYILSDDVNKQVKIKALIMKISKGSQQEEAILKQLDYYEKLIQK
jgi:hypothetical protein